ncbi:CHD1 helical C-terminal domain containing protein 1 [Rhineura floridana]|uniref:CHD1 helical C-terminal domain containing protein 1 n=1 Tax=Rhineura floridana TaxID=261503 RepID=UPI002AC7F153|nr:CHD1 helical C-terminal domain containing protein 1 [Rhineura floridana]
MAGVGERENKAFQATKSRFPTCQASETSHGETLARVTPSGDALIHYADGLTQDTFKICKEFLRPFKKCLRKLNLPKDFPKEKRLTCTRKNLTILGDHINMFLQHYCKTWELKHWKKMLWRFVSLFSALDEKQLCKLYRYSKTDQMAKFLKAYCRLESPDLVILPSHGNLMKLRDTWGLCRGAKLQEKRRQVCSLSPDHNQPAGRMLNKRFCKTSSKTRRKEGFTDVGRPTCKLSVSSSSEAVNFSSVSKGGLLKSNH